MKVLVIDDNPVIVLIKLPAPAPYWVLLSTIVGVLFVLQHTPLDKTVTPPSLVIFPPDVPVVWVMAVTDVVVSTGWVGLSFLHELIKKTDRIKKIGTEILNIYFIWDNVTFNFRNKGT